MKCNNAQAWLLSLKREGVLPTPVQNHLVRCASCRRLRDRLAVLQCETQALSPPEENSAGRQRLLDRLEITPQLSATFCGPSEPAKKKPQRFSRFPSWPGMVLAACVLVCLGWILGRWTAPEMGAGLSPSTVVAGVDPQVVNQVLAQNIHLARPTGPFEQAQALTIMAEALQKEALRLLQAGAFEDAALLVDLHVQVLREGLVNREWKLLPDQKSRLLQHLETQEKTIHAALAKLSQRHAPALADLASALEKNQQQSLRHLRAGTKWERAAGEGRPHSLLAQVVQKGLLLADQADGLQKAQVCADLSNQLAESVAILSSTGQWEQASYLYQGMEELTQEVKQTLAQAAQDDPEGQNQPKVAEIQKNMDKAKAVLERNLAQAPPPAQASMKKALDPPGFLGKGKGNPWGKGHKKGF